MNPLRTILNYARAIYRRVFNRYEGGVYCGTGRRRLDQLVRDARYDVDQPTRQEILRKARYFEANSGLVNRLCDLFECYTIGAAGVPVIPSSSDEDWNGMASMVWGNWCKTPDIASRQGFGTLQSLVARSWFIDGEVFVLLTYTTVPRIAPRVQLIEAHRVQTPGGMLTDKLVVDGIRYSATGTPDGYYILRDSSSSQFDYYTSDQIIHVFEPSRVGQLRGLSFLYPVLNPLHDLDDLWVLEMKAAKEAARTPKTFKTPSGQLTIDQINGSETVTTNFGDRVKQVKQTLGEDIEVISTDESYEQFASQRPSASVQWYWEFLIRHICGGVGMSSNVVYPSSMQGTNTRGDYAMANAWFRARSYFLAPVWEEIFRYVMGWEIKFNPSLRGAPSDWDAVTTRPPRSIDVDGGRTSQSIISELEAGLTTWEDVYAAFGLDAKTQLIKKADFVALIHRLADERKVSPSEIVKSAINDAKREHVENYGVAVRAGVITPNLTDEEYFRSKLGLPPMPDEVESTWEKDGGTRKPITLAGQTQTEATIQQATGEPAPTNGKHQERFSA